VRRGDNAGFHPHCSIAFFGTETPPEIDVDRQNLRRVALEHLARGESITGSQEKFSMKYRYRDKAMMVPGLSFIVKPMQPNHPEIKDLPRMEHVIMRFGDALALGVAKTAFIRLRDGTDAFITRRFDRASDGRLVHAEDMAQATGDTRGLGHTYNGSYEVIARTLKHRLADQAKSRSSRLRFLRATLFNYIFGNTDAHLKNHSIIWEPGEGGRQVFSLAPLYDIVPCLLYTDDDDELGLPLGGKTKGFTRADFDYLAEILDLPAREIDSFVAETRGARQLLVDLARAYEVDQTRIATLFELAARRIAVLSGAGEPTQRPRAVSTGGSTLAAERVLADGKTPIGRFGPDGVNEPALCHSAVCLNPAGRTRLRGRRRRELGMCSYCNPEGLPPSQLL
jgi:serine/threonine-protein kinase HipA